MEPDSHTVNSPLNLNPLAKFISASLAVVIGQTAVAQEADPEQATSAGNLSLEEVTVTAQRKSQNLQSVPIAVSAFGEEAMERGNMLDVEDVSAMTPGFSLSSYNPVTPQPYIRGVGTNSSSVGDDASVGVFIDEVYAGRAGGYRADMFDVQRVEVLRGPQGSLYGRNVAGGAINVITNNPTDTFEAKAKVTGGNYNLKEFRGMLSGPIADSVNGRVAVSRRTRDGWIENVNTGNDDLGNQDNLSVRGKLAVVLGDRTDLMLSADYATDDLIGSGARSIVGYEDVFGTAHPTENDADKVDSFVDGYAERDMYGVSAKLTHSLDTVDLVSITAYRTQDYAFNDDMMGRYLAAAGAAMTNDAAEESSQFSQELRVQSTGTEALEWTAGLYLFQEDVDRVESFDSSRVYDLAGFPGLMSRPVWDASNETTSYAVFGEATYHFSPAWSASFGGRYTYDQKDFTSVASGAPDEFGFLAEDYSVTADKNWKKFTPKATLTYTTENADIVYATISEGYKAGGFNGIAATEQGATVAFDPENATNYEIGFKTSMLGQRVRLNGAVFYLDYTDLQSFTVDLETGQVETATGDAEIKGVELEASALVTDALMLAVNYGYTDSEYVSFESDPTIVGNNLARTPEHSASASINYEWMLGNGSAINFNTNAMYQGEVFYSVGNTEAASDDARTLVNANATWDNFDGLKVSLWGKNLTDEAYVVHAFEQTGMGFAIMGEPTTWGISVTKDFF
ncbi:TonB-dependent receptor [Microbulbifer celer]|uniref:TonB-dependent receptor n=1 Tax=Microbulbifer celer TaxID=435905 RepID=A0ABW3U679_9GAMM|nr:TonB-dependent receptor [Microbulbifer celer]UFN58236.1 TonB-dependent receptor [Microbulbifer celer]